MFSLAQNVAARARSHGVWHTANYAMYRLYDEYFLWRLGIRSAMESTDANMTRRELGFDDADFHDHAPTPLFYLFRAAMRHVRIRPGEDVFVDYGSGTGRAVIMAATYPFRKVIGVEYSPILNEVAVRSIDQVRAKLRCQDVEIVTADARLYAFPHEVTVVYFYNPFEGDVLAKVFDNIRQSLLECPRKLTIVYSRPRFFEQMAGNYDWLIKRDDFSFPVLHDDMAGEETRYVIYESA